MATQRNTNFIGVSISSPRVGSDIIASDLSTVAADIGHTFEKTTGLNADGSGGASTLTQHNHTESGNLVHLPWAHQQFGSMAGSGIDSTLQLVAEGRPLTVIGHSTYDGAVFLFGIPFYVPAGFADQPAAILLNVGKSGGGHKVWVRLFTSANANRTTFDGGTSIDLGGGDKTEMGPAEMNNTFANYIDEEDIGDDRLLALTFSVPTANAVYVAEFFSEVYEGDWERLTQISSVDIGPVAETYRRVLMRGNEARATGAPIDVTVGNPDAANAFRGLDSALFAADVPLGPQALLCAHNLNLIHEKALGLPAPGKTSLTATGHVHDLSRSLSAYTFGRATTHPAVIGALRHGPSPQIDTVFPNDALVVATGKMRFPVSSVNTAAGTSKVRAAVYCYSDGDTLKSKLTHFECRVTIGSTSVDYVATYGAGSNIFHCLTPASGFAVASGDYSTFALYVRDDNSGASDKSSVLLGVCFYCVP